MRRWSLPLPCSLSRCSRPRAASPSTPHPPGPPGPRPLRSRKTTSTPSTPGPHDRTRGRRCPSPPCPTLRPHLRPAPLPRPAVLPRRPVPRPRPARPPARLSPPDGPHRGAEGSVRPRRTTPAQPAVRPAAKPEPRKVKRPSPTHAPHHPVRAPGAGAANMTELCRAAHGLTSPTVAALSHQTYV